MSKKKSKHKKNKNNKSLFIAFVVIFILIIFVVIKNSKTENKNENIELVLNNEDVTSKLQSKIIDENEKIYMSFNDIKELIDSTIYQEDTGLIITASSKKIATFKENENTININGSEQKDENVVIEKDGQKYIAISELENVYDYEFKYNSETNIVTIDSLNKKSEKAYAVKKIKIKENEKIISKTIEKVNKGNWLYFISEQNGIAKVRTQDGKIGYVKTKNLDNFVTERENLKENKNNNIEDEQCLIYDLSKKDITTFEKRQNIINLILQEAIKNDKMYVKITYNSSEEEAYNRFKIEVVPILGECGIKVKF